MKVNSMDAQVHVLQRNMFTQSHSKRYSNEANSRNEEKDFGKVLSQKNEEQKISKNTEAQPKYSKEIDEKHSKESGRSLEASEKDKPAIIEESKSKEQEIDTLMEELIHLLQLNNIVGEEKLQSISNALKEGSISTDELKPLLEGLSLSLKSDSNLNLDGEISERLAELTELIETIKAKGSTDQAYKTIDTSQSSDEKIAQVNSSQSIQTNEKTYIDEENNEKLYTKQEVAKAEESKRDKEPEQGSELNGSKKTDTRDNNLFPVKKNGNESNQHQKDFDLAGLKNIEAAASKDYSVGNIDKVLVNDLKQDVNIFNQILESAKINISEEVSEMFIKLRPDNLGKLSMRIIIDRGMMVAKFDVESQMVKETIESNLEDLKNALKDKGFEIQQFDVSVNKDSDQSNSHFEYFNRGQRKKMAIKKEFIIADSYVSTSNNNYGLNSTISYLG